MNKYKITNIISITMIVILLCQHWIKVPLLDYVDNPVVSMLPIPQNIVDVIPGDGQFNLVNIANLISNVITDSPLIPILAYGVFVVIPLTLIALAIYNIYKSNKAIIGYTVYILLFRYSLTFIIVSFVASNMLADMLSLQLANIPILSTYSFNNLLYVNYIPYIVCILCANGCISIFRESKQHPTQ